MAVSVPRPFMLAVSGPAHVAVDAMLVVAVATALLSLAGVAFMPGVYNRLHYLAPVSVIGAGAVAIAVLCAESFNTRGLKALVVFAVLAALNPPLMHAIARSARAAETGGAHADGGASGDANERSGG